MDGTAQEDLTGQVAGLKTQLSSQADSAAQLRTDLDALKPSTSAATAEVAKLQRQITLLRLQNALLTGRPGDGA